MNIRPIAIIGALLVLTGCAITPPAGALPPVPAPTVTVTTFGDPADEPSEEPTVEPSEEPTVEPTGWTSDDVGDRSAGQQTRDADVSRWRLVSDLLGKPVKESFSAIVRSATYHPDGAASKAVTFSFDRLKWNPKWSDGRDVPIWLNPQVKWETVTSGDLLVLVMPGDGPHQLPVAQLPTYLKAEAARTKEMGQDYWTPFTVYTVEGKPVALVEWYLP
ncbi:MAG: hypothetical protein QM779_09485 [Propionicimonas sp.]|uniref:hypothetical protein n=1 Tax=Propionicimonas sp. TaxID=1955623 RepID=UPI003D1260D5